MISKIKGLIGLTILFLTLDILFEFTSLGKLDYTLAITLFLINLLLDLYDDDELTRVNKKEETD